jgi:hypothetical protein
MTTPATPQPSVLEKIGGELLDVLIVEATAEESYIVGYIDALLSKGETSLAAALTAAISSKIPIVGSTIASALSTALAGLVPTAEGAAQSAFTAGLAALKNLATSLGG